MSLGAIEVINIDLKLQILQNSVGSLFQAFLSVIYMPNVDAILQ